MNNLIADEGELGNVLFGDVDEFRCAAEYLDDEGKGNYIKGLINNELIAIDGVEAEPKPEIKDPVAQKLDKFLSRKLTQLTEYQHSSGFWK